MKRVLLLAVALALAAAPALAQEKGKKSSKSKTLNASGTVTAVSSDSLSVKGKTAEWTFTVDKDTKVQAKGASHKSAEKKDAKQPTVITDFVHVGDSVSVSYHDMGTTKHAANVRVTGSGSGEKKKKK